ncbi:hypothetical protein GCM10011390_33490 [Aureimonas endophytica]|uniref:MlaB-like STAS domain-containing protein n=1 Tax=Aureimonas endophytica TaxID=2027858 RepID=A0A916ZTA5_9HYPH|nr:STAS domain-containing protein [Aureimonas endophytica]GGE11673.1 hypothetical protein GCM10011390_33490 [Aureimonas endophytica]
MNQPPPLSSSPRLDLPAILDIKAAASLHEAVLARRGADLVLDASQVQRLGGQCLQILCGAVAAWQDEGRAVTIAAPSRNFEEGLALLGFTIQSLTGKDAVQ